MRCIVSPAHRCVSRLDWHHFYAQRFNKTQHEHAAILAVWYLLLHIALEDA